jgi:RNA polymerase sigma factor (sigma-70 family)
MTREAYGDAYQKHFEDMVRSFMRGGVPRAAAEEAVQSGWATGWERLHQLRDPELLIWWIKRIVANKVRDGLRSRQRVRPLEPEDTIAVPSAVNLAAIDVERILLLCDARQRLMFSRVYLQECERSLVAQEMRISRQAVNCALSRTRRMLRTHLRYETRQTKKEQA